MSSELKLHYRSKGPLVTESRRVRAPALLGGCSGLAGRGYKIGRTLTIRVADLKGRSHDPSHV